MATVSIRLEDEVRDQLEASARARGSNLSDLLRAAIDLVLERDTDRPWQRGDVPETLSALDRHVLAQQHEILARLTDDEYEREYQERRIRVLQRGYTIEYSDEFLSIEPELSRSDCRLVFEILDMFRILGLSLGRLEPADLDSLGANARKRLSYLGLDFNDRREGRLADFVEHLVSTDRWTEQRDFLKEEGGNSHAPMLSRYQRMLAAYRPIWATKTGNLGLSPEAMLLSVDELRQILDAINQR